MGLIILVFRDERKSVSTYLLAALCVSLMAMMVSWSSPELGLPNGVRRVIRFIDMPNTVLAWLFVKSIMDDRFRLDLKHLVASGMFCVGYILILYNGYTGSAYGAPWLVTVVNLYALGLFTYLAWLIIRDWRGDLIEERRRARLTFVVLTTVMVSFLIFSELVLGSLGRPILMLLKVGVTFFLVLFGYLWFLQIRPNHLAFLSKQDTDHIDALSDKERKLVSALKYQMEDQHLWAEPGLTIGELAAKIGVGEHVLRRLLNSRLGFSNFSRYLQTFRLARAKMVLSDPKQRDMNISTIAFECGFNSISTFNRAFKESEGVSPKTFRANITA